MSEGKGHTGIVLPWDKSSVLIVPNGTVATTTPQSDTDKLVLWQATEIERLEALLASEHGFLVKRTEEAQRLHKDIERFSKERQELRAVIAKYLDENVDAFVRENISVCETVDKEKS